MNQQIDSVCINTIRFLAVDAIQKANSGHPGYPLFGDSGVSIGIDRFGASGPGDEITRKYGMSIENVLQQALALLQRS